MSSTHLEKLKGLTLMSSVEVEVEMDVAVVETGAARVRVAARAAQAASLRESILCFGMGELECEKDEIDGQRTRDISLSFKGLYTTSIYIWALPSLCLCLSSFLLDSGC